MEEVYQKLTDDMEAFNIRAENGFDEYTGIFDNFIAEYGQNLAELQELAHMQVEIMDSTSLLGKNNATLNASTGTLKVQTENTDYLRDAINAASSGNLEQAMKYLEMRNEKVRQTGINYGTDSKEAYERVMQAYNSRGNVGYGGSAGNYRGYAGGIEEGPVTETGMAMLHGTESKPEYVLNNDQAYQLLDNLSTNDLSTNTGNEGTQTVSTVDEVTSTTGVTGNARTELEGINKMISQLSAMINAESLTNSQLIQLNATISGLIETANLLSQITQDDIDKDEARYAKLVELLNGYMDTLQGYLDGYNGYFEQGLGKLDDIIAQIEAGINALQGYLSDLGSLNVGSGSNSGSNIDSVGIGGVDSSVGSGNKNNSGYYSYYSNDYYRDAIRYAKEGNQFEAYNSLWNRGNKVDVTNDDKGTSMSEAKNYIDSILKGSYAEGIEAGEVTETGPVMMHGTKENPEYVLNSDQAGQILENLSTNDLNINGSEGSATASTSDEASATTGVTGNARTVLEGVNKVISQISAMINQEALTNSNLIQIVEILRGLKESQGLLYEVVNADYSADQTHFDTLMAWLQEQLDKLIGYLDGYNEKLDTGNETLGDILDGVNQGVEAISGLVDAINGLASQVASVGSVGVGDVGTSVGSGSSGSSSGNYYYYSKDYLGDALSFASQGDEKAAMNALWNRGQKVGLTGEDYGTNASEALKKVQEALKNSGYAEGIEEGPITDTGLTMVHGSNESPEYILNSDQAGQMLENLSTQDMSNVDSRAESGVGSATTSTSDAGTSTIGVTGNARTTLEGINKIITQISGVINQEALTTSQLIQAVSILRSLKESQDLLYQIMNTDVTNDEARFNELKEYLDTVIQKLWEYLDGYNERLDTGNATLSDILEQAQLGVEAINNLAEGIQGLMNTMSAMQDQLDSISVGGVGSTVGGGSGSSSKGFDFSKDYLGIAIDAAKRGDVDAMNQALNDRNYKVSVTGQNYGTNSSDAQKRAESYLPGYAEGIENGPVTTTGPAMLHGSESNPEYVLNSDQAGNLLENMATTEPPIDGSTDSGLVDDSLATDSLTEGGLTEGEAQDKERNGDTSGTREANAEDSLFGEAGTSVTGSANTVLQGVNKIITQISAMINQQALTNSQLTQAIVLYQSIMELLNTLYALDTQNAETWAERYETFMEAFNSMVENWTEMYTSMNEGIGTANENLASILEGINAEIEVLTSLAETIGAGFEGDWYMTSEAGGKFNGSFGGGKGNNNGEGDEDEYGSGGGGGKPDKYDYETGFWEKGHDYLEEALAEAAKGNTEEAYELLRKRGYKILDTGDNKGTTQAEAVEQIKNALKKAGAETSTSLGDSGIYDADRYLNDLADYNSSKGSSSGSSSRPNYGGYGSADDFDNAIHDAFDQAMSSGEKVTIGNSGLYIDPNKVKKSYASGIENGPVTYTGMAMLHGSPSSPEFVLNSDQAYNLLRNMATANATEFETEGNGSEGTSYILYGDVNLKTDTSPAKFWTEVGRSMQSRWNTSKHNVK